MRLIVLVDLGSTMNIARAIEYSNQMVWLKIFKKFQKRADKSKKSISRLPTRIRHIPNSKVRTVNVSRSIEDIEAFARRIGHKSYLLSWSVSRSQERATHALIKKTDSKDGIDTETDCCNLDQYLGKAVSDGRHDLENMRTHF